MGADKVGTRRGRNEEEGKYKCHKAGLGREKNSERVRKHRRSTPEANRDYMYIGTGQE